MIRVRPSRLLATAAVLGGLAFGLFGGEYSTFDWITLRRHLEEESEAIARLEIEIDSLDQEAESLENDPARQEYEARRRFGMLKDGEQLYRIREVP